MHRTRCLANTNFNAKLKSSARGTRYVWNLSPSSDVFKWPPVDVYHCTYIPIFIHRCVLIKVPGTYLVLHDEIFMIRPELREQVSYPVRKLIHVCTNGYTYSP